MSATVVHIRTLDNRDTLCGALRVETISAEHYVDHVAPAPECCRELLERVCALCRHEADVCATVGLLAKRTIKPERIQPGRCSDTEQQFIRGVSGQMLDVTMMSRPDPSWVYVDVFGHEHRWYDGEKPMTRYSPMGRYTLPTLVQVIDVPRTDDYPATTHYECKQCMEESK